MKSSSSRVFLLLAIVLGVLATVTTFAFLESSSGKDRGPTASIIVAAHDLRPGQVIDPEKDLSSIDIPTSFKDLIVRSLRSDRKAAYKGERVNRLILAGTPVMLADVAAVTADPLSGNMRALAIPPRGATIVMPPISAGDFVEVWVSNPPDRGHVMPGEAEPATAPSAGSYINQQVIDRPVQVWAVGSRFSGARLTAAEQYAAAGDYNSQQTVTLKLTKEQSDRLLKAVVPGSQVTLVLCPPVEK